METRSRSRSPESINTKSSQGKKKKYSKMTGIFINGNSKQRITNDEFDMMVELMKAENDLVLQMISEQNQTSSDGNEQPVRWRDDQKNYHQNYYNNNLKQSYTCEDCGRTISSKSNLSKHKKSKICSQASRQCAL